MAVLRSRPVEIKPVPLRTGAITYRVTGTIGRKQRKKQSIDLEKEPKGFNRIFRYFLDLPTGCCRRSLIWLFLSRNQLIIPLIELSYPHLKRRGQIRELFTTVTLIIWTALGVFCAGCVYAPSRADRLASFAPYDSDRIDGEPARDFLVDRWGYLTSGTGVALSATNPNIVIFSPKNKFGAGSVTAVDRRGYFLTAAHCIGVEPLYLINLDSNGRVQFASARVVWRGSIDKLDLAIIHAPVAVDHVFEWATDFRLGDSILGVGIDYEIPPKFTGFSTGYLAGKIIDLSKLGSTVPSGEIIFHNAPGHPGDSGGPLTTIDGRLIGITVGDSGGFEFGQIERRIPFMHLKARALHPDLIWLRQKIEEDFSSHSGPDRADSKRADIGGRSL